MDVFCRKEIKYLITRQQREILEAEFSKRMVPDAYPHSSIHNIYYDTPDFRLIRHSLEHPVYKEKIRIRCYGSADGEVFLEMKKKYKGIVYKRRLTLPEAKAMDFMAGQGSLTDSQIGRELTYFRDFYQNLQPQVFLHYERDSWKGLGDPGLRITIDEDIHYRVTDLRLHDEADSQSILPPGMYLMEVKAENAIPVWLAELLAALKLSKTSFSKYGRAYERELLQKIEETRGHTYAE